MEGEQDYHVRPYSPEDLTGFLELYRRVFESPVDEQWFDWKYVQNPYLDHVPIVVAERDETLVGASPGFALRLRAGDVTCVALQPCDVMVHPEYRNQGIFSSLLDRFIETYERGVPELAFTFPNQQSLPAFLPEWESITHPPLYYRLLPEIATEIVPEYAGRSIAKLVDRVVGLRDQLSVETDDSLSVRRTADLPVDVLADLYESSVPNAIHSVRDEEFLEWRFSRPDRSYVAYVARRGGDACGALIRSTPRNGTVHLLEFLPLAGRSESVSTELLSAALGDVENVQSIAVLGDELPRSVLRSFSFVSLSSPPFSYVIEPRALVVKPLRPGGSDWEVNGHDIRDPAEWRLSFVDHDTN